jgi:GABA permease
MVCDDDDTASVAAHDGRTSRVQEGTMETRRQRIAETGHHGLERGLKNRHISMIALGGVIGAGLFVGSGAGLKNSGGGILLSYALGGLLIVFVMRMLGEMSAAFPTTGSFSEHADRALGRWAGFTIGWLYWWAWAIVLPIEAVAGAKITLTYVDGIPEWLLAAVFLLLLTATNLYSVRSYGEFEFWFASIKVVAICVFIGLGLLAIFGLLPGTDPVGLANITQHGGFLPHSLSSVGTGLVMVVFAFLGSEIVTLAAGESRNPERAITKAINSVIWRVLVFYLGSVAVVILMLPWEAATAGKSPYVPVLDRMGIPGASGIMAFIIVTAMLSCLNSGLYTASRMAYSLAKRGDAPGALLLVTSRGVPWAAILFSTLVGAVGVYIDLKSPQTVFKILVETTGCVALVLWFVIAATQLRMRRMLERDHPERLLVRMWGFPYLTWATMASIAFVLVMMLPDPDNRRQVVLTALLTLGVLAAGVLRHGFRGVEPSPEPSNESAPPATEAPASPGRE